MLARVWRSRSSASSSSSACAARLISTRLIHGRAAKKSVPSLSEGTFRGEYLKLRSGFHDIKSLDDAIDLFGDMVRSHRLPSAIDFNKLMGVVVKMDRPDVVISLYKKMEMRRIPCNIYSFTILLKCFCSCRKFSFALSTFGKITKLGFQPDVVTFNTLLHGFCLEERISEALVLFDHMVETGCQPNVVTVNTLMNGLCREGRILEAVALLDHTVWLPIQFLTTLSFMVSVKWATLMPPKTFFRR
uniref:Pentatricopeptide repeat-containing protein n=1 Tax=Noccaea caerulescens TaxID=107243 RepID=A0A1J3DW92_NOCCA